MGNITIKFNVEGSDLLMQRDRFSLYFFITALKAEWIWLRYLTA